MDTEREADKKFIPMSGEIGNSKKDKSLGTAEAATNINAVPRAVGCSPATKWIRSLAEEGKAAIRTEQLWSPPS